MVNHQSVTDQEESEKCLQIAQKHLLEDDHQTALHYLYISQQLCPSNYVKGKQQLDFDCGSTNQVLIVDMIGKVEQLITVSEENGRYESERKARENEKRRKSIKCDNKLLKALASELDPVNCLEFTADQVKGVEKIKACTNYYTILGVEKGVNDDDLRKQFRKLALQYHPDKNRAPGSSDAFKKINSAFDTLRDPVRRQHYDLFGNSNYPPFVAKSDNINSETITPNMDRFGDNISANDMFFNVFYQNSDTNHWCNDDDNDEFINHHHSNGNNYCQRPSGMSIVLQILPVILFVCVSILSSYFMNDPVYSLSRTS